MKSFNTRVAFVAYLAGILVIHVAVFWNARHVIRRGYPDFTSYYCAGTMVRQGMGHQLYDDHAQDRVKREFAPDVAIRPGVLPYIHPPFVALFFVPFTYASYAPAFVLWDLLNLGLLLALPFLLRPYLSSLQDRSWALWMLASLAFFPVVFDLMQGQDSILLLFLYAVVFVCLKKNREVLAGGWLALGLFKPHFIVPFVLLWITRGSRRILWGFLPAAAGLGLISAAVVGWTGLASYAPYVLHLEGTMARSTIVPADTPNLRGVFYLFLHGSAYLSPATIAISCGIFLWVAWQCREAGGGLFDLQFALAVVTAALVSYHCLGYDLSILILPIAVVAADLRDNAARQGWSRGLLLLAISILFFSPLQLFLLMRSNRLALIGWAVVLLLCGISFRISWRLRTSSLH